MAISMPHLTRFDPHFVVGGVDQCYGEFTNFMVNQPPGVAGEHSNLVIDPSLPFQVKMDWQLDGTTAGAGNVHATIGGLTTPNWRVDVYAESMGPGPEIKIHGNATAVPIGAAGPLPMRWSYTAVIPAGTLSQHSVAAGGPSGVYKLCTVVFANSTPGTGTPDICGYCEGPMILCEVPA